MTARLYIVRCSTEQRQWVCISCKRHISSCGSLWQTNCSKAKSHSKYQKRLPKKKVPFWDKADGATNTNDIGRETSREQRSLKSDNRVFVNIANYQYSRSSDSEWAQSQAGKDIKATNRPLFLKLTFFFYLEQEQSSARNKVRKKIKMKNDKKKKTKKRRAEREVSQAFAFICISSMHKSCHYSSHFPSKVIHPSSRLAPPRVNCFPSLRPFLLR